jgi:hypothetical protein
LYQYAGLVGCLWACVACTLVAAAVSRLLPSGEQGKASLAAIGDAE